MNLLVTEVKRSNNYRDVSRIVCYRCIVNKGCTFVFEIRIMMISEAYVIKQLSSDITGLPWHTESLMVLWVL